LCYPDPGSDVTTQCLGSFCVTQILGQTYQPSVWVVLVVWVVFVFLHCCHQIKAIDVLRKHLHYSESNGRKQLK